MNILSELILIDEHNREKLYASHTAIDAEVVPSVGDWLSVRSVGDDNFAAPRLQVGAVNPLATYEGFHVLLRFDAPNPGDVDEIKRERALREALKDLGWELYLPASGLPEGADADDLDED